MKHNFKNLTIWSRARALVKLIYECTRKLPNDEKFGLSSQMRRAAVSIPSNIAEGCGRKGNKELIQFLHIAIGSCCELETQLYLMIDLEFGSDSELNQIINEVETVRRMTMSFIKNLQNS